MLSSNRKYAKCVDIVKENGEKIYVLRTADDKIARYKDKDFLIKIHGENLRVINLTIADTNKIEFVPWINDEEIANYTKLESINTSEESERAFFKSSMLGKSLVHDDSNDANIRNGDSDLIITDRTNRFLSTVRTDKITFIGNKRIDKSMKCFSSSVLKIICDKAIIKNRCVFGNIVINKSNAIRVVAKHVYASHEFIDLNTVNESMVYLANIIDDSFESRGDSIIEVDFNRFGISSTDVVDRTLQIIYEKLEEPTEDKLGSITAYMSLACSMYISTGYKYNELISIADKLNTYEFYNKKEREAVNKLLNNLKSGKRY